MKKIMFIIIIISMVLIGCTKKVTKVTMENITEQPNFFGVVEEVIDKSILVSVNPGQDEIKSSDKISISLTSLIKDSDKDFSLKDSVQIFYDGNIAETYPAQINNAYAIFIYE